MSQVANEAGTSNTLGPLYAPIREELAEVESILRGEMRNQHPFVDELVRYGCLLGGKRLRPALLLLAAKATGSVCRDHLVLGAVVEMIHTATLVHDDVLDEADMRRHLATVNARWDTEASVLLGDYLFTHAFYLASTLESTDACRLIGRATNIVCEGEIRQKGSKADFELDEETYISIIDAKTAELTACSCQLGARFSGASAKTIERLAGYGRNLGIAFQIADDLLDVTGDESETGKSLGTDLEKQKPTLPLIRVLQLAESAERDAIFSILNSETNHRREALSPYFARYNAIEYARDKANLYARQARENLAGLGDSPSLQVLSMLCEFVVSRSR